VSKENVKLHETINMFKSENKKLSAKLVEAKKATAVEVKALKLIHRLFLLLLKIIIHKFMKQKMSFYRNMVSGDSNGLRLLNNL